MRDDSIESSLDSFFADGHITEVVRVIKGGKEGTVYCCRGGPLVEDELVAAKVYHPIEERGFRNDAIYQGGRMRGPKVRRERLALTKKSAFGRRVQYGTWGAAEFETLGFLYDAGSDVPRPIEYRSGALLMQYIGDGDHAAPPLIQVELERDEAQRLLRRIMENIATWLGLNRVHGDLSPYNILYWNGAVTIIDFPQAVDPRFNHSARTLLERDLENVCRYFDRFGVHAEAGRIARQLWNGFVHGAVPT
ncbi:MAG: RIO1 family regulatory kinase/ATPase [Candidatus Binataceae bacterium]